MNEDNEEDSDDGPIDLLVRARLDLEEAEMRVGRVFRANLELIMGEMGTNERQKIENEVVKLGHAPRVFSSDKIIITGFSKKIFRYDHARVGTECQQLLIDYGIT